MEESQAAFGSSAKPGELPCYYKNKVLGLVYTPRGSVNALLTWSLQDQTISLLEADTRNPIFSVAFSDIDWYQGIMMNEIWFCIKGKQYPLFPAGIEKSRGWVGGGMITNAAAMAGSQKLLEESHFNELLDALKSAGKYRPVITRKRLAKSVAFGFFGTIAVIVIVTLIVSKLSH